MFPTIDKQRTGDRIRMLMKQQNITVKQIQEYLNLSCVQGIYHWLDGTSMPTVDNLYALSSHGFNCLRKCWNNRKTNECMSYGSGEKNLYLLQEIERIKCSIIFERQVQ